MTARILVGHVLDVLPTLPAESVHCVVTSPPYRGLRAYRTEPQVWGGEPEHEHRWGLEGKLSQHLRNGSPGGLNEGRPKGLVDTDFSSGAWCRCGAWCGELGLEPTIELYVTHIVAVFREVGRVLRRDGTLWLNMGDSYTSGGRSAYCDDHKYSDARAQDRRPPTPDDLKPKDLCMMPARVALALQADGWCLRSENVWVKPNPMPESVTDRPTSAHEMVFLLSRSEKYYYDAEAVREPHSDSGWAKQRANGINTWEYNNTPERITATGQHIDASTFGNPAGRNMRNVWIIPTSPYPEAHFATFPSEIPRRAILAGTSQKGCCPACGAPWRRVTQRESIIDRRPMTTGLAKRRELGDMARTTPQGRTCGTVDVTTTGWEPGCGHGLEPAPCLVLDPFTGSGTTNMVAERLGRDSIGIELKLEYAEMARRRIANAFAELPSRGEQDGSLQGVLL